MKATLIFVEGEGGAMFFCRSCEPKDGVEIEMSEQPLSDRDVEMFCYECRESVGFHDPTEYNPLGSN